MTQRDEKRHPHIARLSEVAMQAGGKGSRYQFVRRALGQAAGGQALGCSHMELPPGKKAWPAHYHCANEEAIFILEGEGRVLIGSEEIDVEAGDYIALPRGPAAAHQMTNRSATLPLKYLCFSTMLEPDVTVYPESGKFGVFAGAAPGGKKEERYVEGFYESALKVDYWSGEEVD